MKHFLKDEGQKEKLTFLPEEKRKTENPEQPPALHCRREREICLSVRVGEKSFLVAHSPSLPLSLSSPLLLHQ